MSSMKKQRQKVASDTESDSEESKYFESSSDEEGNTVISTRSGQKDSSDSEE